MTKFCGIFTVSRANSRQITDGIYNTLVSRLGWKRIISEADSSDSGEEPSSDIDINVDEQAYYSDMKQDVEVSTDSDSDAESLSEAEMQPVSVSQPDRRILKR